MPNSGQNTTPITMPLYSNQSIKFDISRCHKVQKNIFSRLKINALYLSTTHFTTSSSPTPTAAPPSLYYTPGTGRGAVSEFSRLRGSYTEQHGNIIGWGEPAPAVSHHDVARHIGGGAAGQEQHAVGHLSLVACPLQRNGWEGAHAVCSVATWRQEGRGGWEQVFGAKKNETEEDLI